MLNREIPALLRDVLSEHKLNSEWLNKKNEAEIRNPWFTQDNISFALDSWVEALDSQNVEKWLKHYPVSDALNSKTVGIIMAGNLPLVGLHDLLCALIAGYKVRVKAATDDEVLMKHVVSLLIEKSPGLQDRIEFSDNFKGLDAAIATGSNNSNRYFEYYFRNIPHLLRGHRNGVAVLTGNETEEQLIALGEDIFRFFGLGCRNVTHVYLPAGQSLEPMCRAWEQHFYQIIHHHKYANNYNYHKSILLMNLHPHLDLGFILLKETSDIYSPVGILGFSYYDNLNDLMSQFEVEKRKIQVIVSDHLAPDHQPFGKAQHPELWDYADGVDTLDWLLTMPV